MMTFTKEQLIASAHARIEFAEMMLAGELEPLKERTWSIELELAHIALASLEANGTLANEGTIKATQFKPVADLYEATVPSGRSTTFTKDAAEASDCRVMGWSVQEYVKLDRYQAAMLQGADGNSPAGWVACSERMPEQFVEVLACTEDGGRYIAALNQRMTWDDGDFFDDIQDVTHWQPLPSPPSK